MLKRFSLKYSTENHWTWLNSQLLENNKIRFFLHNVPVFNCENQEIRIKLSICLNTYKQYSTLVFCICLHHFFFFLIQSICTKSCLVLSFKYYYFFFSFLSLSNICNQTVKKENARTHKTKVFSHCVFFFFTPITYICTHWIASIITDPFLWGFYWFFWNLPAFYCKRHQQLLVSLRS